MNFTYLITDAENAEVNIKHNEIQEAISRGIITQQEAQFIYAQFLVSNYKRHAFTIYCNSPAFGGAAK